MPRARSSLPIVKFAWGHEIVGRGSWLIRFANMGSGTRGIGLSDRRYWIAPLGAHLIASWPSKWRTTLVLEDRAPVGRPATDCDILGYPRLRKRGIIPVYKDLVKRVTPATGFIVSRFVRRASERAVGARSVAVGSLGNLRIDKPHKYIIVVARKDCGRSPKMVAEKR